MLQTPLDWQKEFINVKTGIQHWSEFDEKINRYIYLMYIFQKVTQINFSHGVLFLFLSGLISTILSISIDMTGLELGALINYFWPGLLTIVLIVLFDQFADCPLTYKFLEFLWAIRPKDPAYAHNVDFLSALVVDQAQ